MDTLHFRPIPRRAGPGVNIFFNRFEKIPPQFLLSQRRKTSLGKGIWRIYTPGRGGGKSTQKVTKSHSGMGVIDYLDQWRRQPGDRSWELCRHHWCFVGISTLRGTHQTSHPGVHRNTDYIWQVIQQITIGFIYTSSSNDTFQCNYLDWPKISVKCDKV